MGSFDLVLQTASGLQPPHNPSAYVTEHSGTIRYVRDDGKTYRVGLVRAHLIHVGLAHNHHASVFEVCDSYSPELYAVYEACFDLESDWFSEEIRDQFDGLDSDCLVLDYIVLHPRWRGLKVGLLAARKMVDLLGSGCGLTVARMEPMKPQEADWHNIPTGWVPPIGTADAFRESRRKLRKYFRRMGFRRIGRTPFYGLSMARITPTAADLLRPFSR